MNLGKFTYKKEIGHYKDEITVHPDGSESRSSTWIRDGYKDIVIEVTIDPQKVANAVSGAAHNKSGIAKYLHGAVVGKVVS